MKSRTSFFNLGVLKKDVLRFSPLWGSYTVLMLLYLFLSMSAMSIAGGSFMNMVDTSMSMMGTINLFYGGFAALLLFGDLFKSRLCNAMHAMPLRREGWFLTHFASGMLFCIVPNLLGACIGALFLGNDTFLAWAWLGMSVLQFFCFFSIGVLSVQFAGTVFGAITVYLIINLLWALVSGLLLCFYAPMLFGVALDPIADSLTSLSPALRLAGSTYVKMEYDYFTNMGNGVFKGFVTADWRYLFLAAASCLVLSGCALLLYRKRHLENAGDLLAVKAAKPVFLILYTLYVGAAFYLIGGVSANTAAFIIMVLLGLILGFFTGWMILEKRLNIFTRKRLVGLGVFLGVFFFTIFLTWLDPAGITRYVPEVSKVESVTISPYYNAYYPAENQRTLTEPGDIEDILQLHQQAIQEHNENTEADTLYITYRLTSGRTVQRSYFIEEDSPIHKTLKHYYSHPSTIFGTEDVQDLLRNAVNITFNSYDATDIHFTDADSYTDQQIPEDLVISTNDYVEFLVDGNFADNTYIQGLIAAIEQDCREGNMAQIWEYHGGKGAVGYLSIEVRENPYRYLSISIYEDSTNAATYLKELLALAEK